MIPAPDTSAYDRATAIAASDGGWTVDLDGSWSIGGYLNGGYLLVPMAKAAAERSGWNCAPKKFSHSTQAANGAP